MLCRLTGVNLKANWCKSPHANVANKSEHYSERPNSLPVTVQELVGIQTASLCNWIFKISPIFESLNT